MKEEVILIDKAGKQIGVEEKIKAHKQGLLHRAFSIFIFNKNSETLLQQRDNRKYHSGGLWANACCSHPRPGESLEQATHRRLKEELGFDCGLVERFSCTYKVKLDSELFEHERDYVFTGLYDGLVFPNSKEVANLKWMKWDFLLKDVVEQPSLYAYWLKYILKTAREKKILINRLFLTK